MESEGSLQCSQKPLLDCPNLQRIQISFSCHISVISILILSSHLYLHIPSILLLSDFSVIINVTSVHSQHKMQHSLQSRSKCHVTVTDVVNIAKYFRRLLCSHFPISNNLPQIKSEHFTKQLSHKTLSPYTDSCECC